jgi:hypothetical protein
MTLLEIWNNIRILIISFWHWLINADLIIGAAYVAGFFGILVVVFALRGFFSLIRMPGHALYKNFPKLISGIFLSFLASSLVFFLFSILLIVLGSNGFDIPSSILYFSGIASAVFFVLSLFLVPHD